MTDRQNQPRRRRSTRLLLLTSVALALGACNHRPEVTPGIPSDVRQRHPIVVKESPRVVELLVGSRRGGLTPDQRADVLAFAHAWNKEATGGVIIDVPSGTSNAAAAAESVREARSILAAAGVPPRGTEVRPYQPNDPNAFAPVRISYPRVAAEAGPCGLWPEDLGPSVDSRYMQNQTHWNHGCSSQRNLAAMVTNPTDLVQPRAEAPIYTARRSTVLDKYRQGQPTATQVPNENKGKISNIGQ
jgi:pilus assembly protein CpaD